MARFMMNELSGQPASNTRYPAKVDQPKSLQKRVSKRGFDGTLWRLTDTKTQWHRLLPTVLFRDKSLANLDPRDTHRHKRWS